MTLHYDIELSDEEREFLTELICDQIKSRSLIIMALGHDPGKQMLQADRMHTRTVMIMKLARKLDPHIAQK